jgi:hypothetical protein
MPKGVEGADHLGGHDDGGGVCPRRDLLALEVKTLDANV